MFVKLHSFINLRLNSPSIHSPKKAVYSYLIYLLGEVCGATAEIVLYGEEFYFILFYFFINGFQPRITLQFILA